MAPGVFFVYGTIHPTPFELNRYRTFILEHKHFPYAGDDAKVLMGILYVRLGVIGIMVGYSTELAAMNKFVALKPAVWVVSFGLLVYAMVMACLHANRCYLPGRRNKHDWGHAAMEAGAKEWSTRQRAVSEHPLSPHGSPSKEGGTS